MATKRHKPGGRRGTKKGRSKSVAPTARASKRIASAGASKLDAGLDPNPPSVKTPRVEQAAEMEREESRVRSAGQSGSLQGLSDLPEAAPESVDELLEEGNAREAGVVEGVEDAPDADQGGIRTREVPEDDVPEEYLENEP